MKHDSVGAESGIVNPTFYQELSEEQSVPDVTPRGDALPQVTVSRPLYQQHQLNDAYQYRKPKRALQRELKTRMRKVDAKSCCSTVFPLITWLPEYSWGKDLVRDLISGCTVAVMHIPQGIGYALLANVPPIVGIYMAFFPVLVYFLFGTSRHNSMGTFAVVSIMVGKTVLAYTGTSEPGEPPRTALEVATAVCFVVGIMQLIMCVCRLGVISFLLSDTLVSGFTTGAAIHVVTSQIKDLLGLTLPSVGSMFEIVKTYIEIFKQIVNVNWAAIIISTITIVVLVFNNEILKPRVAKRSVIPIPIELIAVIAGTLLSRYLYLQDKYSIKTIGTIPTGLPAPTLPDFSLMPSILIDSFPVAMVGYTVSVSMALIFAKKENYEIGFNQELFAMGTGNVFASFFSCFPFAASLSRSSIQYSVGGRTQIASVISCGLLAIVLLWVGPFFEPLPRCVLAGIIVVSLKGLLMQVTQLKSFWRQSWIDGMVWILTFLSVVLLAIDIGLLVGIVLSICCIFFRALKPYTCLLGNVPNTDIYLDVNRYDGLIQHTGIKLFHYCGALNFASRAAFKTTVCETLGINLTEEIKRRKDPDWKPSMEQSSCRVLVLDFTSLSSIDPSAVGTFKAMVREFEELDIQIVLAGCQPPVFEVMLKCGLVGDIEKPYCRLFTSVHDAVQFGKECVGMGSISGSVVSGATGIV
ncbi:solute carrier family 26 member 10-like [Anopheles merus]|uniref:solute carrier family 26 member 10-like n=1 Tax=Anopheles merus TaxID=30066 RepID=UPI001BE3EEF3|nr:solute carrier family 26 member 10-like [Anopheles merus]XP_041785262.1 solute carrier family 26 member 10-like [Anopheles merus]